MNMFESDNKKYYIILKKDATKMSSQGTDKYLLDLKIYNSKLKLFTEKNNLQYLDEAGTYKDQLKAGSKWEATFIPDPDIENEQIMEIKPIENNQHLSRLYSLENEENEEVVETIIL